MKNWDYEKYPNREKVTLACQAIQARLADDIKEMQLAMTDTRSFHQEMFNLVTPANQSAFAGNYRGSNYIYLKNYNVRIGKHFSEDASQVKTSMLKFHSLFVKNINKFNEMANKLTEEKRLIFYSRLIGHFVVTFLTIHPYANGNSHISRLLAWALFCYKGFNIQSWDLDKRPDQPFDQFISQYQQGKKDAMAHYFYQLLLRSCLGVKAFCCSASTSIPKSASNSSSSLVNLLGI